MEEILHGRNVATVSMEHTTPIMNISTPLFLIALDISPCLGSMDRINLRHIKSNNKIKQFTFSSDTNRYKRRENFRNVKSEYFSSLELR